MDGEGPVVGVERRILVRGDEGDRLARHAVLDVFIGPAGDVERGGKFPRRDVAPGRTGAGPVGEIHVEALLQRAVGLGSEVPFAEVARSVASCLERFRERVVARIEAGDTLCDEDGRGGCGLFHRALFQNDLRQVADRRGDADARGIETGEDARARRRAEWIGGICLRETHPARREPLEMRRLVKGVRLVQRGVGPPEIVGKDEEEIGWAGRSGPDQRGGCEQGDGGRDQSAARRESVHSLRFFFAWGAAGSAAGGVRVFSTCVEKKIWSC